MPISKQFTNIGKKGNKKNQTAPAELPHKKGNRRELKTDSLPHNIGNPKIMRKLVTKQSKKEYINEQRQRYRTASRPEQTQLLDEMIKVSRWNRKYLIRVLNKQPARQYPKAIYGEARKKLGRPKQYDAPEILAFVRYFWHTSEQACGKRMKGVVDLWLPWYEQQTGIVLSPSHQAAILKMSAATFDRYLVDERRKHRIGKGRTTTKPGTLLKKNIPIKTEHWQQTQPGHLQIDTVAHCGASTAGQYVSTLNTVDVASGWVEPRAVWGTGEQGVVRAFKSIENTLPFALRGVHSDNGHEFLNRHMDRYLRARRHPVEFTRSREYRKNDNAHIEGKNWTHIREYFGYQRFDNQEVVDLMNDLFENEYCLYVNIFLPSVKLLDKKRVASKIIKTHDKPRTPCQRLLDSPELTQKTKCWLRTKQRTLNPFLLHEIIRKKIKVILSKCSVVVELPPSPSARLEVTPLALRARSVTSSNTARTATKTITATGS